MPAALVKRQKHHFNTLATLGAPVPFTLSNPCCPGSCGMVSAACHCAALRAYALGALLGEALQPCNALACLRMVMVCNGMVRWSPAGLSMVLGCNGMVWLAPLRETSTGVGSPAAPEQPAAKAPATPEEREAISRAANAVRLLSSLSMNISPASLLNVCRVSV